MDDRALLKQAFLEACSAEKKPSEQELEHFTVSGKTDRKIHRMIYRKSRRKRVLHTISVAARSTIAVLLAIGMFFFPRIETDAEQSEYMPVWMKMTSREIEFTYPMAPNDNRYFIGRSLYQIAVLPEELKDCEPYRTASNAGMDTIWKNEKSELTLSQYLPGGSAGYDNEHCVEYGWKTVGERKVYIIVYTDSAAAALWVEGEWGSDYVMSLFYCGENATSAMMEQMVSSLYIVRR